MDNQTIELLRHYAEKYNAGDSAPNCVVEVYRMDGDKGYEVAPFVIPDVMEVSLDRRYNLAAGELKVMISNVNGKLSPNYSPGKRYDHVKGLKPNGFSNVLVPFNKIVLYLGYGDEMRMMFTGLIVSVDITERSPTIVLTCKDMYRKLLKAIDPETEKVLVYKEKTAGHILTELFNKSDTPFYFADKTINGDEYTIPVKIFPLGTQYSDAIKEIVEMLAHRVYCSREGVVVVEPLKRYAQEESAKLELNDYVNLTSGEYTIDSTILRNRVVVQANDGWKAYEDLGLIKDCNGEKISCALESPWATDEKDTGEPKRKQAVADRFFMDQRKRYRRLTIGAKGHPALDVGDLVRVRELISTANSNYMITGIKTSYSSMGYVDTIDLEYVSKDVHIATLAEGQYQGVDDVVGGGKVHMLTATDRDLIVDEAVKYRDVLYQHNGDCVYHKEHYGLDVPHFIFAVYKKFGLMTEFKPQQEICTLCDPIEEAELQKGDLVFYSDDGDPSKARNVAVYAGDGKVIVNRGGSKFTETVGRARAVQAKVAVQAIGYNGLPRTYMRLKTMKEGEK